MTEIEITPENPHYNREQVIAAFKKFVDQGVANPDDLPLGGPEVASANAILDAWSTESQRHAEQNPAPDAALEYSLSISTVHVDAGFADPDFLDEVANDWLAQDLQQAKDAGLTAIATRIQAKIDKIQAKLSG